MQMQLATADANAANHRQQQRDKSQEPRPLPRLCLAALISAPRAPTPHALSHVHSRRLQMLMQGAQGALPVRAAPSAAPDVTPLEQHVGPLPNVLPLRQPAFDEAAQPASPANTFSVINDRCRTYSMMPLPQTACGLMTEAAPGSAPASVTALLFECGDECDVIPLCAWFLDPRVCFTFSPPSPEASPVQIGQ
jgi:hypothetical protein